MDNKTPLELAKQAISDLYEKHADDPNIFSKMHNYVCFRLPGIIDDMKRADAERRERNDFLTAEQDAFINSFLNRHRYFYCASTERFFYYDGIHYKASKEDDVLYHILSTITNDRAILMPRKPQTKVYVMKRVKDSNPLKSIPESGTIQSVLDLLCPAIFATKPAAKYFLSVIGDHLLKKTDETTHVYFATAKAKEFLRELGMLGQIYFGVNATASFKHKYHSHSYKTIRLLKISDAVATWRSILFENVLDLFCVAAHYSDRYECADKYLELHSEDVDLVRYTMYFRGKNATDIVADFKRECLICYSCSEVSGSITTSTMEYLWRKYLKDRQFPTVLGQSTFLTTIVELLPSHYDEEARVFNGITNPSVYTIEKFQRFWKECMSKDDAESSEYEIGELTSIYRLDQRGQTKTLQMTETQMLDLIRFYNPDIQITDNKYIHGVYCNLWDKRGELDAFFETLYWKLTPGPIQISFYDAYTIYLSDKDRRSRPVSKSYFEKYICVALADFVGQDGCTIEGDFIVSSEPHKERTNIDDIQHDEYKCVDRVPVAFP
jgi:hypothetical protein